ncbi:hypothetical protein Salat_1462900 [Sesamum alatum]|uniref:Uncharacterized protein n=1 Tax=Sesamum alatum TaxID=300844 RepID=A0AAE1YAZ7_9LAMI|nr:hypothetical protein Salat_1462900 [Sesamum alatum]
MAWSPNWHSQYERAEIGFGQAVGLHFPPWVSDWNIWMGLCLWARVLLAYTGSRFRSVGWLGLLWLIVITRRRTTWVHLFGPHPPTMLHLLLPYVATSWSFEPLYLLPCVLSLRICHLLGPLRSLIGPLPLFPPLPHPSPHTPCRKWLPLSSHHLSFYAASFLSPPHYPQIPTALPSLP